MTDDETQLIEVEITSMCVDYNNVYLIGDMNAHTGYKADFIEADQFLADYFDFDSELLNYFNKSEMLDKYEMFQNRPNQDSSFNSEGGKLIVNL